MLVQDLGIIGGGQLAWMMAGAASKLGVNLYIQTPKADDPAVKIAKDVVLADISDSQATEKLANFAKVITFENEFVDLESLEALENNGVCFHPSISSLKPLLDKLQQREFLRSQGIPTPQFEPFTSLDQVLDYPLVLKARRGGYDGQGTFIIRDVNQLKAKSQQLQNIPFLVEQYIPFTKELAVIAARSVTGEIAVYPVVETFQENQVCRWVYAPAQISQDISQQVEIIASKLLTALSYIGVMGIEFFLNNDGQVLVNEIAPRTHNSGHYSLNACSCSQFEMQLRAILGMPLGSSKLKSDSALMVNLLGYETSYSDYRAKRLELAKIANAYIYWYDKTQSKPGRKLGHVTITPVEDQNPLKLVEQIEAIWRSN